MEKSLEKRKEEIFTPSIVDELNGETIWGVSLVSIEGLLKKLWLGKVDSKKLLDDDKKKITSLYMFYNRVAKRYWEKMETEDTKDYDRDEDSYILATSDQTLKLDLRGLASIMFEIKELDKDAIVPYLEGLVILEEDSKTKRTNISPYIGLIRLPLIQRFFNVLREQISNQERIEFLWGLRQENSPEIIDYDKNIEESDLEFLKPKGEPMEIESNEDEESDEVDYDELENEDELDGV
jgi:hypothetical protein